MKHTNAGLEDTDDNIKSRDLLAVNVKDKKLHLSRKEVFLGSRVEDFLERLGLSRESPELNHWIKNVFNFYMEATTWAFKYFSPALSSRLLMNLEILNPKTLVSQSLDDLKKKWQYVAERFDNVVKRRSIPDLLDQVAALKAHPKIKEIVTDEECTTTSFFHAIKTLGDGQYHLVGLLGSALNTAHNASTAVERDFSIQNALVGDPRKNRTSQNRLQSRLTIKTNTHSLKNECLQCQKEKKRKRRRQSQTKGLNPEKRMKTCEDVDDSTTDDEEGSEEDKLESSEDEEEGEKVKGEKSSHCHCPLFRVSSGMLAFMNGGQPSRRYQASLRSKREERKVENEIMERNAASDKVKEKSDLKSEVCKLRSRARQATTPIAPPRELSKEEKRLEREKRKTELAEKREDQRRNAGGFLLGL